MSDDYIRIVKNIAEEGTELLGYTIIFYASSKYLISYFNSPTNNFSIDDKSYQAKKRFNT